MYECMNKFKYFCELQGQGFMKKDKSVILFYFPQIANWSNFWLTTDAYNFIKMIKIVFSFKLNRF